MGGDIYTVYTYVYRLLANFNDLTKVKELIFPLGSLPEQVVEPRCISLQYVFLPAVFSSATLPYQLKNENNVHYLQLFAVL